MSFSGVKAETPLPSPRSPHNQGSLQKPSQKSQPLVGSKNYGRREIQGQVRPDSRSECLLLSNTDSSQFSSGEKSLFS